MASSSLARSRTEPVQFTAFYEAEASRVLRFFARRVLDGEVALDLTAETFAQAFAARGRFRGADDEDGRAWLFAIARAQLAAFLRRGYADRAAQARLGLERPPVTEQDLLRVDELAGLAELREAVTRALARLPARQRDAVRLRIVDELDYPEVAQRLNVSEQTARARVSRALRRLAEEVSPA
ncbi:RNA polymerase sigma factor [Patulibacter minatonensis]|uniref:RNA polymerase sigma factor n=1 Tax=Patulibacter minatonensis TaxID=298163 RepID=UPI000564949D|nr:sigma-70 family RNA polymerase sigma factor [Patulibacter minatonensis]